MANARLVPLVYGKGWRARFYVTDVPAEAVDELCEAGSQVVRYDATEPAAGMLLRFLPAGDPSLEVAVVRDADSRVNPREARAVADWLDSASGGGGGGGMDGVAEGVDYILDREAKLRA